MPALGISIWIKSPKLVERVNEVFRKSVGVLEKELDECQKLLLKPTKKFENIDNVPTFVRRRNTAGFWNGNDNIEFILKTDKTPYVWIQLGQGRGADSASAAGLATFSVGYKPKTQFGTLNAYPGEGRVLRRGYGKRIKTIARKHHELVAKKRQPIFEINMIKVIKQGLMVRTKTKYVTVKYNTRMSL